jgi:hypothetical protein
VCVYPKIQIFEAFSSYHYRQNLIMYRIIRNDNTYLQSVSNTLRCSSIDKTLNVSGVDVWDEGFRILTLFLRSDLSSIREIRASRCGLTNLGVSYLLDSLLTNSTVRYVCLSCNHIDDCGARMIREFNSRRSSPIDFDLSVNPISSTPPPPPQESKNVDTFTFISNSSSDCPLTLRPLRPRIPDEDWVKVDLFHVKAEGDWLAVDVQC